MNAREWRRLAILLAVLVLSWLVVIVPILVMYLWVTP